MAARPSDAARRAWAATRRRLKARLAPASPPGAAAGANASAVAIGDPELWPLHELYPHRFQLRPIAYGTAADYADSTANLFGLVAASTGMKNLQRCWTVKAVLGAVEPGARLLEIGAGEPLVAGLLSRLGYEVTVVDPYDGSGNGPREYARFTGEYPDLRFVRDRFPPARPLDGSYGCVYSVSVLEHVAEDAIPGLLAAASELVGEAGVQIHAVDHVLAGWGAEAHRDRLERIVAGLGLGPAELAATIETMERDPETYLVSVEAHDQWRGAVPYGSYPMRRIGSVHLFSGAGP